MPHNDYDIINPRTEIGLYASNLLTGTNIGIAVLCSIVFGVMYYFVPIMMEGGMGAMKFIVVPVLLLIAVVLFFMTITKGALMPSYHSLVAYAAYSSYLITPALRSQGWIGHNKIALYFVYAVIGFLALIVLEKLTTINNKATITFGLVSSIFLGYMIGGYYIRFGLQLLVSAGWLGH